MERRQDMALGLVCAALGIFAAVKATSYAGAAGAYPMALGFALAGFGAIVAVRGWLRGRPEPRPLTDHAGRVIVTVAMGAVYLALVPLLGFYTASVLLVVALPLALGFRRPLYLIVAAGLFVAVVWMVFSVVLEKPLPDELWASYS